jgi:hypothetical protein
MVALFSGNSKIVAGRPIDKIEHTKVRGGAIDVDAISIPPMTGSGQVIGG